MSRNRNRRRSGGQAPAAPTPGSHDIVRWLSQQISPAVEADKAWVAKAQPQVIVLPRTTTQISEAERIRRSVMFGRPKPVDTVSFDALRAIARHSLINAAIHARRRMAVRACARKWDGRKSRPGWAIIHANHFQSRFDATTVPDLDERIRRVERLFLQPHPRFDPTMSQLVVKLVEDHLTVDRITINTLRSVASNPDTPTPYPTVQMTHVDGATVWPADLYLDRFCALNGIMRGSIPDRDLGIRQLYEHNGVDLRDCAFVQVDPSLSTDAPVAFLREEDIRLYIANPSPELAHYGFGISPAEGSYSATSLFLHGISYVSTFFRDAFSEMVGVLAGANYQDEDARVIADVLRTHYAGIGNMHRTPIVRIDGQPGDLDFKPTRAHSASDMEFSETLHRATMFVHAHYGIHPSETFQDPNSPSSAGSLNAPDREAEVEVARDEGLFSILDTLADDVFTPIVQEWDPDLRFAFLGLDDKSEQAEVELRVKRIGATLTINEGRKEENLPPLGPWADYPGPQAQAAFQAEMQQQQQQQQMELQQQYGPPQGAPGAPGGQPDQGDDDQGAPDSGPLQKPPHGPPHMQWDQGDDDESGKAGGFIEFEIVRTRRDGAG